jgi:ABC-type glycerol-3-phosphate transport system permease component
MAEADMTQKTQKNLLDIVTYTLLVLGAVIMVVPFLWMISTSFKLPADQFTKTLVPDPATLSNFTKLFNVDLNFPLLFLNSTVISVLTTAGQLLTCSMAAFCFAVVKFKGRNLLFGALLGTLLIPFHVTLIPNFIIFSWLHLVGTSVPLWLPAFWGGAFGTFLIRQYFLTIPRDLVDAARVDGASLLQIFWKVYMPIAKPALAALAIFTFQGAWNDLLHPLIYMPAAPNTTLTVGLAFFQQQMSHGGQTVHCPYGGCIHKHPATIGHLLLCPETFHRRRGFKWRETIE